MMLSNKEELGLSDEQVNKVKELKMNTKKDIIRKDAEIEILALEIKSEMWKDPADTVAVNKLVDKKYDLKKETTKALVAGCAALKDVLTKDHVYSPDNIILPPDRGVKINYEKCRYKLCCIMNLRQNIFVIV